RALGRLAGGLVLLRLVSLVLLRLVLLLVAPVVAAALLVEAPVVLAAARRRLDVGLDRLRLARAAGGAAGGLPALGDVEEQPLAALAVHDVGDGGALAQPQRLAVRQGQLLDRGDLLVGR